MNKSITFAGWGQAYDSLECVAPEATHIDYGALDHIDKLYQSLGGAHYHTAIGWSLGGQLALRAIDAGAISVENLVIIASPFCFLENNALRTGMSELTYNNFKQGFLEEPQKSSMRFSHLIARNDKYYKEVKRQLRSDSRMPHHWLYWLQELEGFVANRIDFKPNIHTTMIHGSEDSIVDVTQTGLFRPFMPNMKLQIIEQCGHAPHLHDTARVKAIIGEVAI